MEDESDDVPEGGGVVDHNDEEYEPSATVGRPRKMKKGSKLKALVSSAPLSSAELRCAVC